MGRHHSTSWLVILCYHRTLSSAWFSYRDESYCTIEVISHNPKLRKEKRKEEEGKERKEKEKTVHLRLLGTSTA
ncbi:hypothetical protein B0T13DRAFT_453931 [Neurospora crassa]|nr:hypothetical protein B0T13DRAFT_453931 [Neurospora crassa]